MKKPIKFSEEEILAAVKERAISELFGWKSKSEKEARRILSPMNKEQLKVWLDGNQKDWTAIRQRARADLVANYKDRQAHFWLKQMNNGGAETILSKYGLEIDARANVYLSPRTKDKNKFLRAIMEKIVIPELEAALGITGIEVKNNQVTPNSFNLLEWHGVQVSTKE